ncbi:hypothetical protein GCM10027034_42110 [Ramlibacter solisilvae]|uniref:hypothetical protein n=1 Tax=Ramlibacter tataouinensis TaxID=94132 RepID=UPI001314D439|nr:hypothetical protein [Ramlibacter tataouinensis]
MAALLLMRLAGGAVRLLPGPLHRALDAWSLRVARRRRERRFQASARSAAHAK